MYDLGKFVSIVLVVLFPLLLFGQERLIKPGDAIEILAPQTEGLSKIVIVKQDGTVEFPGLQGLPVDGITLQRFKEVLVNQLSSFMGSTPLLMVRFSESYPIKINVLGQVARPGLYQIANTATLQGAIGAAGGFIPGAQLARIRLISKEDGEETEQLVNMEQFYLQGDPAMLPLLKDDDTVVVPGNPLATNVKVLGEVENPGSYEVFFKSTVLDVIFLAGGPTENASLKKVKIVSFTGQDSREVSINIKELMASKGFGSIPIVVPGDVVFIPEKKLSWSKFFNLVRDASALATLYYLIDVTRDDN